MDDILSNQPDQKIALSKKKTVPVEETTKKNVDYNLISSITLDRTILCLNPNDQRKLYADISYETTNKEKNESYSYSSSNEAVATVNQEGIVTGVSNGDAVITLESKDGEIAARCSVSVKRTKYLAVTFDDGPGPYTDQLVDGLVKYNSRATFFILGYNLEEYPEQLKHEYESHMEIGNHTYHHKDLKEAKKKLIRSEINSNADLIYKTIGAYPTLLRPPYGVIKTTLREQSKVPIILWSVDTEDWEHQNTNYIYKYIKRHAGDGEILLLHDIHQKSVEGFLKALPDLIVDGYELVTVSELYELKQKPLEAGKIYYGTNLKSK
jgi:peptidoglycan/xylan/chitin deacetylase (PgdA/CDA1 family)